MKRDILLFTLLPLLALSCSPRKYSEPPFGGMKGRVEMVKTWHLMPDVWRAGTDKSEIMYITVAAYDPAGNEICSALLDSLENIQSEAENIFDNGLCIRSTEKSYGLTVGELKLVSAKGKALEYDRIAANRSTRIKVEETYRFRRSRSTVSEDGVPVSKSIILTDKQGYPLEVRRTDKRTGVESRDVNTYDVDHNIIEKHSFTPDGEEILYIEYSGFDEHGNWLEATVVNRYNLPVEVLRREIKYWK